MGCAGWAHPETDQRLVRGWPSAPSSPGSRRAVPRSKPEDWGSDCGQPWAGATAGSTVAPSRSKVGAALSCAGRSVVDRPNLPTQAQMVIIAVRSGTTYAAISAAGKKTRLKRRYRKKLCPKVERSWIVHPVRGMRLLVGRAILSTARASHERLRAFGSKGESDGDRTGGVHDRGVPGQPIQG